MHRAYCGFNCEECPVYQATSHNDVVLRVAIYEQYHLANPNLTWEDLHCHGCKSNPADHTHLCNACEMRRCARATKRSTCAACPDYPCDIIERSLPPDSVGRKRLDALVDVKNAESN